MTIQKKAQQGFTLIELMIVIAIVGILAAIALPAYQDYIVRSKMTEPLAALSEAKTSVTEYVSSMGKFPATGSESAFGINTHTRYDSSDITNNLDVIVGTDKVYLIAKVFQSVWAGGDKAEGTTLSFQLVGETTRDGSMQWTCLPGQEDAQDEPIEAKYLPANCRG